ncbi:helix-turn-helix domain-containing protein [Streptomyces cinereoruber]|uniref:helix-turn-helix domain-containing protein n=1 Tax=Streptomyces cinereoruber TaxID=67260 RepID=UPI0036297C27
MGWLAQELRTARHAAGLTQAQAADLLGVSAPAVQRSEAGRRIANKKVVDGYVEELGLDAELAAARWAAARRNTKARRALTGAPAPRLVSTEDGLSDALVRLWEKADRPRPMAMQQLVEPLYQADKETYAFLSKSAADRIIRKQQLPSKVTQLCSYLAACGVPEARFPVWIRAYARVQEAKRKEAAAAKRAAADKRREWSGWYGRTRADLILVSVGHEPVERFPRSTTASWTVRCTRCGHVSRTRLDDVLHKEFACQNCGNAGTLGGAVDLHA